ncbi:MAG: acyl-CoA dehydrogenase family protein [Synergistaceae bacterium]|nr:acyl-CoA dehydrogenase family protein [Synergistaceae bacterium]
MHFFEFSEEQKMLRKAIREFVESEVAPLASEWDEKDVCPGDVFKKLGELGVNGIFVPERYGGAGLGHVERAICLEEISRHSAGLGMTIMTHHLGIYPILQYGSDEQKDNYLPYLCSGAKICGLAVTEPGGGSDFSGQKTLAEKADTGWIVNGRKCFITNSHNADVTVFTAKTGEDEKGRNKLSAFIVERGAKGFEPGRKEHKLGLRASVTGDLVFADAKLSDAALLGKEGGGSRIGMEGISEIGRGGMSAIAVGILRGCLEEAIKFANERIVYGKPIAKLQAIQFEIAKIRTSYEAARLLTYYAASLKDAALPCANEVATAKLYSTEASVEAAKRTMDLMGGYGVINEYAVGRFLRDALTSIPSGGTSHIHQIVIAGGTLKDFQA